ncbi:amidase [Litorivivens lipolytica]|uniref:Amidase n=1 Tax=Litorivivens lipolytica TaxID=1524264 RepID=A0A7W4W4Q0_9GAMM|nr:amidase [Litorivivens lipolytica]MBB3047408.1 amidase [Litorivivens lipolytica]
MSFKEYADYDALGLAELINKGEVTPKELLAEAIKRRDRVNPKINAVIRNMDEQAFANLDHLPKGGPFYGVPFLLKDFCAAYKGVPLTNGSRAFKDYIPDYDCELVKRFKAAGLVTFGKTNTPEFAIVGATEPSLHGKTCNPWNLERTAGGSSGGSGAAVAAGIVPMASGGDGGGSLRIPAACGGLVGFKTTRGRIPHGPDHGDPWYGQVQDGVVSRSVRDSAAMLDALRGVDLGAPYAEPPLQQSLLSACRQAPKKLRIAFSEAPLMRGGSLHPEAIKGLRDSVKLLEELGHELVEDAPVFNTNHLVEGYLMRIATSVGGEITLSEATLGRKIKHAELEPETWMLAQLGRSFSAADFDVAHRRLYTQSRLFERFMQNYDVFLTPTLSGPAVEHGYFKSKGIEKLLSPIASRFALGKLSANSSTLQRLANQAFEWVSSTMVFNITGNPSVSLPLHWSSDRLPVGMMFTGRFGEDDTLFSLAGQLEQAKPWWQQRAPVFADE